MSYIPIMKYKERVDISAYDKHELNDKETIPMIEVFQEDKFPLGKINGDKIFYLGILFERNMKFKDAVEFFLQTKDTFPNMIPVINSDYSFDDKKATIKAFKQLEEAFPEKIAFKFNNIKSLYIHENLENIMLMHDEIETADIFLDLDYAYKFQPSAIVMHVENAIDIIRKSIDENINNFIIAGSIIKVTSSSYTAFEDNNNDPQIVENPLLIAFWSLKSEYENMKYADYTIDEKHVFTEDETSAMAFYPMVKFTLPDGKIAIYKSNSLKNFNKYKTIAGLIYRRPEYSNEHCEGCQYIESIVNGTEGGKGTGSPTTWKIHSMIHHIRTMADLLYHI